VRWRTARPVLGDRSAAYVPVLEVHLAAPGTRPLLPVSSLQPLAGRLGRAGRDAGLFGEDASLTVRSDAGTAWAISVGNQTPGSWNQVSRGDPKRRGG
jgi:hypothetical protein